MNYCCNGTKNVLTAHKPSDFVAAQCLRFNAGVLIAAVNILSLQVATVAVWRVVTQRHFAVSRSQQSHRRIRWVSSLSC